MINLLLIMILK